MAGSYVYVIATLESGNMVAPCKIGLANRPVSRLRDFQTASAFELTLYTEVWFPSRDFAAQAERAAHDLAKVVGCHRRGEWVDLGPSDAMLLVVCAVDAVGRLGNSDWATYSKNISEQAQKFLHLKPDTSTILHFPMEAQK